MTIVGSMFKIMICWIQEFKISILLTTTLQYFGRNYGINNNLGWCNLA